jgi:alpha/beta superfamily hydrolase
LFFKLRKPYEKMWQMCSALMLSTAVFCAPPAQAASTERGIFLATANGEIQGSLLQPEGGAKVPVVLIIAGSGPTNRNGNSAGSSGNNNSLKMLAEGLANQGYASVRFDKRGVNGAAVATTESAIRFETYVDDAAAWLKMLKADTAFF